MKRKVFKKCSIEGCEREVDSRGFCQMHYIRMKNGNTDMRPGRLPHPGNKGGKWRPDDPRYKNKNRPCDVPGCNGTYYANGLCRKHDAQRRRKGFLACTVSFFRFVKCSVENCKNMSVGIHGLCSTHYDRKRNGADLNRPIGVKGELNHWWKGGVAQYQNHYEMKKIRKIVLEEENYTCYICGKPTKQIHHLDGTKSNHDRSNLRACCASCNLKMVPYHTSKYKRAYGKKLFQITQELGISAAKAIKLHRSGELINILMRDEVNAVLF